MPEPKDYRVTFTLADGTRLVVDTAYCASAFAALDEALDSVGPGEHDIAVAHVQEAPDG